MARSPRASRGRRGLRKLPPELISQAQDQTAATITRIMLTFVGLAIFSLLSLFTPDAALLTGREILNVPFAGPVSFRGFIILGPLVLIGLWIYLQIYVEHWRKLERIRRRLPLVSARPPTLTPLQNPLLRSSAGFVLYVMLPLMMVAFTVKAAVYPVLGLGLLCATVVVIGAESRLLLLRWPWPLKSLAIEGAAILAAFVLYTQGTVQRPFYLFRADLSNEWLSSVDLRGANLLFANLERAYIGSAELEGADLSYANLRGATLVLANLKDAGLEEAILEGGQIRSANLSGANLQRSNLGRSDFRNADLTGAMLQAANLEGADLRAAKLTHADLTLASLTSAMLVGANLTSAMLVGSNLKGVDLRYADLTGADLTGVNLTGANLTGANLTGANVARANLKGSNLEGANLEGAIFERANLRDVNFQNANLESAILERANLRGARLRSAKKLTKEQLSRACGDDMTWLAPGLRAGRNCVGWPRH
jgi:uncharacterized protein YjbI with pentapeptide repeats